MSFEELCRVLGGEILEGSCVIETRHRASSIAKMFIDKLEKIKSFDLEVKGIEDSFDAYLAMNAEMNPAGVSFDIDYVLSFTIHVPQSVSRNPIRLRRLIRRIIWEAQKVAPEVDVDVVPVGNKLEVGVFYRVFGLVKSPTMLRNVLAKTVRRVIEYAKKVREVVRSIVLESKK